MSFAAHSVPNEKAFWFLPLGGCGEIGMNMNLYGHNGHWLMVDCGIGFDRNDATLGDRETLIYAADPEFIVKQRDKLSGIVITHAHEDHIGALPYLWPRLRAPVYTTAFTAEVLRRKLARVNLADRVPIHVVGEGVGEGVGENTGEKNDGINGGAAQKIGPFEVSWIELNHSVPETCGVLIRTPVAKVFHSADWKLDADPVIGRPYNKQAFKRMAAEKIDALVCDSTNACEPGWSNTEGEVREGLLDHIKHAKGRVVVACFGSNIARLLTLARIAEDTQRSFSVLGRSLTNMLSVAKLSGYWPEELNVIDSRHLGYLPPESVLVAATGGQGEPRTALANLALDKHFDMELARGDSVIFSTRVIPGNEKDVERLIASLKAKGVNVLTDANTDTAIHSSGHAHQDELQAMYNWVQPHAVIPVHGEDKHMQANAELAKKCHVPRQLLGADGDAFVIAPHLGVERGVARVARLPLVRE